MYWGICPRVSGGQTQQRCTLLGPAALGKPGPSGAQVSLGDQSLKLFFVRRDSPISQSVVQAGPQVVGDSAEAVGSGRAPTCATTLIPHTAGDLSWAGRSSSVIEFWCLKVTRVHARTHARTHIHAESRCMCAQENVWVCVHFKVCKSSHMRTLSAFVHAFTHACQHANMYIYINNMTFSIKTKKNPDINFILSYSRCNQKQMSACLEGLFKHASGKIYGRV